MTARDRGPAHRGPSIAPEPNGSADPVIQRVKIRVGSSRVGAERLIHQRGKTGSGVSFGFGYSGQERIEIRLSAGIGNCGFDLWFSRFD